MEGGESRGGGGAKEWRGKLAETRIIKMQTRLMVLHGNS